MVEVESEGFLLEQESHREEELRKGVKIMQREGKESQNQNGRRPKSGR